MYSVRVTSTTDTTATDSYSESAWTEGSFRVESFRRATFVVSATTGAPAYVAGDFFEGTVEGRYLFGAPMGGQPVTYSLDKSDGAFTPEGFDAFRFGPLDVPYVYDQLVRDEGVLGADGTISRRVRLQGNDLGQPMTLTWEATVTDPARQEQAGRTSVTLHPALFYVGLRVATTYLDVSQKQEMAVDVVTVDPAGAPVGDKEVEIELVRQQWNSVREVGADGRLRWRSEKTETTVGRQRLTTRAGRMARVTLPVTEGGAYVVRASATDLRGNAVRTDAFFWAAGGGYTAWERADDDRIELIPEKTSYAPGETARLLVQSPFESATALVTVEREGVISSRLQTLTGSAPQIEIELDESHLPNVFVSVVLLNGRTARPAADADPGAPQFRMGLAELRVDPGARHLSVEVEPDQDRVPAGRRGDRRPPPRGRQRPRRAGRDRVLRRRRGRAQPHPLRAARPVRDVLRARARWASARASRSRTWSARGTSGRRRRTPAAAAATPTTCSGATSGPRRTGTPPSGRTPEAARRSPSSCPRASPRSASWRRRTPRAASSARAPPT